MNKTKRVLRNCQSSPSGFQHPHLRISCTSFGHFWIVLCRSILTIYPVPHSWPGIWLCWQLCPWRLCMPCMFSHLVYPHLLKFSTTEYLQVLLIIAAPPPSYNVQSPPTPIGEDVPWFGIISCERAYNCERPDRNFWNELYIGKYNSFHEYDYR